MGEARSGCSGWGLGIKQVKAFHVRLRRLNLILGTEELRRDFEQRCDTGTVFKTRLTVLQWPSEGMRSSFGEERINMTFQRKDLIVTRATIVQSKVSQ